MNQKTDNLFSKPKKTMPFKFDEQVAQVFPDMIKRSVPGYQEILNGLHEIAKRTVTEGSNCYDLGCSLGAVSLVISNAIQVKGAKVIGIDNSLAMLNKCQEHIAAFKHDTPIELCHSDLCNLKIENASLVVLNFTLQFIAQEKRQNILQKIYSGMNPGGILILSEKINFDDSPTQKLITALHHEYKANNGYSELEISQKRTALENILIPETLTENIQRLKNVGFEKVNCWLQYYNFASLLAIK